MKIRPDWLALAAVALLTACGAGKASELGDGGGAGSGLDTGGAGGHGLGGTGGGVGGGLDTGGAGGVPEIDEVFGHSSDVLYRLDPITKEVTAVGPFSGCSSVIDIAIDKDNNMYGTTFDGLYTIDKTNAHCTLVASGNYPNSLSFVPVGTLDPNEEAMVGYLDADYVRIDKGTGQVTTIGGISGGYISSGDIVSVINGGTYLTVKNYAECDDCLFQVDPMTGDMVKNWGAVGHSQVFGLAYWGGKAYGFSNTGELFEISFDQSSVSTVAIPIPGAPVDLRFWGAGSSTAVPVDPPA